MNLIDTCVVPALVDDLACAAAVVRRDGAAIVAGDIPTAETAREIAFKVFAGSVMAVPDAARVLEGGEMDRRRTNADNLNRSPAHTDGYGYGDLYPDYFLLSSVHACDKGGENFLIDGYALLDAIRAQPAIAWVADALAEVAIDQTEVGMQTAVSTVIQDNGAGRMMLKRTVDQRPAAASTDVARDQAMIDAWAGAVETAVDQSTRFRLEPGQTLVVDNYRMFHGREPYFDLDRLLWRVWIWTNESRGVPEMQLHSDTRHAHSRTG